MKTGCSLCEVPFGRVVHPASVYHNMGMMSMVFEWYSGPHSRLPTQPVHLTNRVHCGLRFLLHQQRQEAPATVANIAYPTKATDRSRLEVGSAQVE